MVDRKLSSNFLGVGDMLEKATEKLNFDMVEWKLRLRDPWYQLVMKMLTSVISDFSGREILEVGCGIGGFCINAACKGARVVGVDLASEAIQKAKNLAKRLGVHKQTDFIVADAHCLPFKDKVEEIVVCSETLEHVLDYKGAFSELVRVTQKSGYLCLTVPNLLSTLFFEHIVLRFIGQPQYVKRHVCVEKEDIFHIFKLRNLLAREDLTVMKIRSTNFLHVPPRLRSALRITRSLQIISDRIEEYFEVHNFSFRLLGANLGALARKR
jgi:ubiquinone/menaquinone biosynthesis C-methylase UbiE